MELESAVKGRRSIRRFTEESIPKESIVKLVEMAIEAPSPGNQQSWHFYVITENSIKKNFSATVEAELDRLIDIAGVKPESMSAPRRFATWFKDAPAVIAVSTRQYRSPVDNLMISAGYTDEEVDLLRSRPDLQSVGAAIQNLLLAAHAGGYGACWLTGPMVARRQLEKILGIMPPESLAALIALGRAGQEAKKPERKPVDQFITFVK